MKKQYVLEEQEYLALCSQLERIGGDMASLFRETKAEDQERLRPLFVKVDQKLNSIKKDLNWM